MAHLHLKLISINDGQHQKYCEFSSDGGSIGRSDLCDLTLFDVERFVSKKHAEISFRNNQFYVSDLSTNGVFINTTSNLLGSGNSHLLKPGDLLIIGEFKVVVDDISVTKSFESSDGLLDLVMGSDSSDRNDIDSLSISDSASPISGNSQSLGLNDILDSHVGEIPAESDFNFSDYDVSSKQQNTFKDEPFISRTDIKLDDDVRFEQSPSPEIPSDWELSGIMPAISSEYGNNHELEAEKSQVIDKYKNNVVESSAQHSHPIELNEEHLSEVEFKEPYNQGSPEDSCQPVLSNNEKNDIFNVPQSPDYNVGDNTSSESEISATTSNQDVFFETLYKKLDLPEEYMNSINKQVFAEETAEALLLTTKGLMSLLNGRSIFKQESRLSLTSVQPRSNNPLKFSIDPSDSLEMLLLKKKAGYMNVEDSFTEAINDVQSHQMAFVAGLQATLSGILSQLEPHKIESEALNSGTNFMGMNSSSKRWKLYSDKQKKLSDNVKQNLNDVLSKYFADAYQAQIEHFKKNL